MSSPRADNLSIICDLVFLISDSKVSDSRRLFELVSIIQEHRCASLWRRTRQYHYISALRDLELIKIHRRNMEMTSQAYSLARIVTFGNLERRPLNEAEKAFLREHLISYEPLRNFLSRFLMTSMRLEGYEQLRADGGILILEKDNRNGAEILIKPNGQTEPLENVWEIKWTLKNWCKDLDIIDEIFLERDMTNIGDRHRRVFFPLKTSVTDYTLEDFKSKVNYLLEKIGGKGKRARIPLLMYDFCTTYFLPVKGFHYLLGRLYQELPDKYSLEKIPSVYIDERPHRVNGYTNYPKIGDCYRYSLVVR